MGKNANIAMEIKSKFRFFRQNNLTSVKSQQGARKIGT
jgi:hypothetical protein